MSKVLVVGYYNHYNLGDEQYKFSIRYILETLPIKPQSIDFIDCDQLYSYETAEYSTILLGGGDVLNHYFLDKINKKFEGISPRPKIVAFSVGIPYNSIFLYSENLKKLEIFDYIWLRTKQDIPLFSQYFPENKLGYLPDASCFLLDAVPIRHLTPPTISSHEYRKLFFTLRLFARTKKIININLCRHIYHSVEPYLSNYQAIIRELAVFIDKLIQRGYIIVLLPFNTKPVTENKENHENDILIQQDVLRLVSNNVNIIHIDFDMSISEILSLYQFFYMSVPMRFHGTLFSIHAGVPMVPIYTTKKIKNALLDIEWNYGYSLETNEKDLPTKFDSRQMMGIFMECAKNHTMNKLLLRNVYENFKNTYQESLGSLCTTIIYKANDIVTPQQEITESIMDVDEIPEAIDNLTSDSLRLSSAKYPRCFGLASSASCNLTSEDLPLPPNTPNEIVIEAIDENPITKLEKKLADFAKENGYQDFREISDPVLQQIAVCIVSYYLTNQIDTNYNHGMIQKMFSKTYDFKSEWGWVLNHHRQQQTMRNTRIAEDKPEIIENENPDGIFDIEYIDQNDRSGAHRSGWKFVYDNIRHLHRTGSPIKLDLYVDRTFHWKRGIYREIGIIPYTTPWIGFIHHTFDTQFSEYNNTVLLKCPEFLASLRTCRGLIVLSNYLKGLFDAVFSSMNIEVPVFVLRHPTEIRDIPQFDLYKFLNNPDKKLVHIGGWLRNIFSFYRLELRKTYSFDIARMMEIAKPEPAKVGCVSCRFERTIQQLRQLCSKKPTKSVTLHPPIQMEKIRKVALKGKFMDNYYPESDIKQVLGKYPDFGGMREPAKFCSGTNTIKNNWMKHMIDYIESICDSVEIIDTLENPEYDELLTQNLVFLNLTDGSAINTLIECVVRNTPIVVNRHPAVIEVLGENYPLYYKDISEVDGLLMNTLRIRDAHLYMKNCLDKTPYLVDVFVQGLRDIVKQCL